ESVEVSPETMLAEIKEPPKKGDASALIKDLGAEKFQVREAAQKKILAMGPAVLPQITPLLKSADPEVAARAEQIVQSLSGGAERTAVRRLMAIRTLGELKCAQALPALKDLTKSKELFVADYARRAAAAIEGGTYSPPSLSADQRMADVWMLPKGCGVVAQCTMSGGAKKVDMMEQLMQGMAPLMGARDPQEIVKQMLRGLLPIIYKIGNVRVDSVTLGVADNVGRKAGYVVVIARGLYDAEKAKAALAESMAPRRQVKKVGQLEVYCPDDKVALVFASNHQFIFVAGSDEGDLPLEEVALAVSSGKGTLEANKELAALVRSVDRSGPIWAAAKMSPAYREAMKILAPFQAVTFSTTKTKDGLGLTLNARGEDEEKVKAAVAEFNDGVKQALEQAKETAENMPAAKPAIEFLQGIQVSQDAANVRITAPLKTQGGVGMIMAPLLLLQHRSSGRAAPPQAKAAEARARAERLDVLEKEKKKAEARERKRLQNSR
ncbi:MAG TPA: hypothetical protein VMZ50_00435, partial [Phycisphaerae bacterium]|nr:hypothetical protein [Phycisphaerae bacterium]